MTAGTLIQAHPTPTPEIQYVSTVSGANTHKLTSSAYSLFTLQPLLFHNLLVLGHF